MANQTIFALASGRPPAAIGIIRISGPQAHSAAAALTGSLPPPRKVALRSIRHPATGDLIDQGLVLRFDGVAGPTGEDLAELHCHGGRAVIDSVLDALATLDGLRIAEPGEFTRRAFENGRIDLTEAEGLADLLEAETEAQRKAALALAEGGLRRQIEQWQQQLLLLSARAEAAIDYVDDDAVGADEELGNECGVMASELVAWLERPRTEILKEGVRVVVAGPPNAGKSSLINCLCGQERSIVTDVPGTTRDHIEVPLAIGGIPILLTDTAGVRETDDPVERIGVDRSRGLIEAADLLVWLGEPHVAPQHEKRLLVHSKCDLYDASTRPEGTLAVSSRSQVGVRTLLEWIVAQAKTILPGQDTLTLNTRQASVLTDIRRHLQAAESLQDIVLVAEELRSARNALDRLTGRAGVEDVLDALFGRFCLGK